MSTVSKAVNHYSNIYHEAAFKEEPDGNRIMSPFGAWILAALETAGEAESYKDETVNFLEKTLGLTVDEAFSAAAALLKEIPNDLTATAAAWVKESAGKPGLGSWMKNVSESNVAVEGTIPEKKVLDAWAEKESLGLIKEFPFSPDDDTLLLMATVIACKVQWLNPFRSAAAPESMEFWNVPDVLLSVSKATDNVIVRDGKTYGVHVARSSGLAVISVISDEDAAPTDVLKEAMNIASEFSSTYEISSEIVTGTSGSFWSKTVEERSGSNLSDKEAVSYLPAWSASTNQKLDDKVYGLIPATESIAKLFDGPTLAAAVQVAVARFNRFGFEAAALTAVMIGRAAMPVRETRQVEVSTVNFQHPYAVVAVPTFVQGSVWEGVPVFSAWVSVADSKIDTEAKQF